MIDCYLCISESRVSPSAVELALPSDMELNNFADYGPPVIQEEEYEGNPNYLDDSNEQVHYPDNVPLTPSPSYCRRHDGALSRQNAVLSGSSGSLGSTNRSSQDNRSRPTSLIVTPSETPKSISEPSHSYHGSVPNVGKNSPYNASQSSDPPHHSHPSLSFNSSMGSRGSGAFYDSQPIIPKVPPPPYNEPRRRGSRNGNRSGSSSPNQLQLPLHTFRGSTGNVSLTNPYKNTMLCPPSDGAPTQADCGQTQSDSTSMDQSEVANVLTDLAEDETLAAFPTDDENEACDAEVKQITDKTSSDCLTSALKSDSLKSSESDLCSDTMHLEDETLKASNHSESVNNPLNEIEDPNDNCNPSTQGRNTRTSSKNFSNTDEGAIGNIGCNIESNSARPDNANANECSNSNQEKVDNYLVVQASEQKPSNSSISNSLQSAKVNANEDFVDNNTDRCRNTEGRPVQLQTDNVTLASSGDSSTEHRRPDSSVQSSVINRINDNKQSV